MKSDHVFEKQIKDLLRKSVGTPKSLYNLYTLYTGKSFFGGKKTCTGKLFCQLQAFLHLRVLRIFGSFFCQQLIKVLFHSSYAFLPERIGTILATLRRHLNACHCKDSSFFREFGEAFWKSTHQFRGICWTSFGNSKSQNKAKELGCWGTTPGRGRWWRRWNRRRWWGWRGWWRRWRLWRWWRRCFGLHLEGKATRHTTKTVCTKRIRGTF